MSPAFMGLLTFYPNVENVGNFTNIKLQMWSAELTQYRHLLHVECLFPSVTGNLRICSSSEQPVSYQPGPA